MSLPRAVVPGRTYLITRRCSERRFLMRPDRETSNAFVYCLALAAHRHHMGVIAFGTMSNHAHIVVVDYDGHLPAFLQYFHRLFACHQNALRGRWESFWTASEQASAVHLVDTQDVIDKAVYAITNPVKDGIVDQLHHWPGPESLTPVVQNLPLVATRPCRFFRPDGDMPETVTLPLVPPHGLSLSHEDYATLLRERVEDAVAKARAARLNRGARVLGRKAVLRQHWNDRPQSREPRRTMSPRVACRSKWARIEALQRSRAWLCAYREARARWIAGDLAALFPAGVWWLRCHAGVMCESHPPS